MEKLIEYMDQVLAQYNMSMDEIVNSTKTTRVLKTPCKKTPKRTTRVRLAEPRQKPRTSTDPRSNN